MQLEYEVTDGDMLAFTEYHMANSPSYLRTQREWQFGVAGIVLVAVSIAAWVKGSTFLLLVGILFAAIWIATWPREFRKMGLKQAKRILAEGSNRSLLGPQRLEIRDDGLRCVAAAGESLLRWPAIDRIASTTEHTFVYVAAAQAFAIPKLRVLVGHYDTFVAELARRVAGSRPAGSP
jgi:hypothetical protein